MKSELLTSLERIADVTGNPVVITDGQLDRPGPRILYVNEHHCRMTGYTKKEIIGQTPRIFQGPRTDRMMLDHLKRSLAMGKNFQARAINYRKGGEAYWLEWTIVPLTDSNGDVFYYANQRDVSLNKEKLEVVFSEQSLALAASQILEASVALNNIIYELSEHASANQSLSAADLKNHITSRSQEAKRIFEKVIATLR